MEEWLCEFKFNKQIIISFAVLFYYSFFKAMTSFIDKNLNLINIKLHDLNIKIETFKLTLSSEDYNILNRRLMA